MRVVSSGSNLIDPMCPQNADSAQSPSLVEPAAVSPLDGLLRPHAENPAHDPFVTMCAVFNRVATAFRINGEGCRVETFPWIFSSLTTAPPGKNQPCVNSASNWIRRVYLEPIDWKLNDANSERH